MFKVLGVGYWQLFNESLESTESRGNRGKTRRKKQTQISDHKVSL